MTSARQAKRWHKLNDRYAAGDQCERGAIPGEEGTLVGQGEAIVGFPVDAGVDLCVH
jgi:hypothetical protein